jgi:hypothetical protein
VFWLVSSSELSISLFHYCLPLIVLVSLSLVKTKGQITIVYIEELWGCHCHYSKYQFHNHQTSEYVPAYNSHKISYFITLLHKAMISAEGRDKTKWRGYLNLWSLCCCHMVLRMWGQEVSFVFVTWDPYILVQAANNLDMLSETEQPTNTWYSNHIFMHDSMAKC